MNTGSLPKRHTTTSPLTAPCRPPAVRPRREWGVAPGRAGLWAPLTTFGERRPPERLEVAPSCLFRGENHPLFFPRPFSRPLKPLPLPSPPAPFLSAVPALPPSPPRVSRSGFSCPAFPFLSASRPPGSVWVCCRGRAAGSGRLWSRGGRQRGVPHGAGCPELRGGATTTTTNKTPKPPTTTTKKRQKTENHFYLVNK